MASAQRKFTAPMSCENSRKRAVRSNKQIGKNAEVLAEEQCTGFSEETGIADQCSSDSIDDDEDELQFVSGAAADEDNSCSESGCSDEQIEAAFDIFDPREEDESSLLLLLRHSPVYRQLNLQPRLLRCLASVVAAQANIGSVARAVGGGDADPTAVFGFVSLVSVGQHPEATGPILQKVQALARANASEFVQSQLCKMLCNKESSKTCGCFSTNGVQKSTFTEENQKANNVGLFLHCRFTNLPLEVAAEAVEGLAADVKWSLEVPEMAEEERMWYHFSHIIGISLVYRDVKQDTPKKPCYSLGLDFPPVFAELEHQALSEGADFAFVAPTNQMVRFSRALCSSRDDKSGSKRVSVMESLKEYLLVYGLTYDKFEENQRKIKTQLSCREA